jgi:hypothetical protein
MTEIMHEEYKEEYPEMLDKDPNARMAFQSGFTSYKSDSVDYLLEHNDCLPLTLVLFYDSGTHVEEVMRTLAIRLMDCFVFKNEPRFKKANGLTQELSKIASEDFDLAIPIVLENVSAVSLIVCCFRFW